MAGEADMSLHPDAGRAASVGGDDATGGRTWIRYHIWYHRCRGRLPEGWWCHPSLAQHLSRCRGRFPEGWWVQPSTPQIN